jgi:hypothetical protein
MPIGSITAYGGEVTRDREDQNGWLRRDVRLLDRRQPDYSALFDATAPATPPAADQPWINGVVPAEERPWQDGVVPAPDPAHTPQPASTALAGTRGDGSGLFSYLRQPLLWALGVIPCIARGLTESPEGQAVTGSAARSNFFRSKRALARKVTPIMATLPVKPG